jgi:hypothetical protein
MDESPKERIVEECSLGDGDEDLHPPFRRYLESVTEREGSCSEIGGSR